MNMITFSRLYAYIGFRKDWEQCSCHFSVQCPRCLNSKCPCTHLSTHGALKLGCGQAHCRCIAILRQLKTFVFRWPTKDLWRQKANYQGNIMYVDKQMQNTHTLCIIQTGIYTSAQKIWKSRSRLDYCDLWLPSDFCNWPRTHSTPLPRWSSDSDQIQNSWCLRTKPKMDRHLPTSEHLSHPALYCTSLPLILQHCSTGPSLFQGTRKTCF